ncbi:hypothetical protein FOA43_001141 [Brettanomyces nanus]|uniref:Nitrogen regulatory protein areA GATA-like domain-containing protein n=1 Tax=Eeniella nana TaxID=13502 RepID=A0A875RXM9_EENNA|nr:uncharacterized protein FOA43_001141 [Brettanomyces nanus]QPG73826.1 hypothetical protein FOA43_001141 [Brettanomyces nanus]
MSKEVFNEGPTTSQHVESADDDYFKKTTFKLKRTRSMGLLDGFINQAHSTDDESSRPTTENPNKITSRDFVSDATLQKLNLIPPSSPSPYTEEELNHVPSFYTKVMPSKNSTDVFQQARNIPSGVSLVPKHELRRQEIQQQQQQQQQEKLRQHHIDLMASHALHDDTDVEDRPKQHVDYLSHKWGAEDEVLKCWRYVVLKKHDFADAARLENASWRTWAQTRSHLKTISPEELNWSKDSDVTWLYGPAFREEDKPLSSDPSLSYSSLRPQHHRSSSYSTAKHSHLMSEPSVSSPTAVTHGPAPVVDDNANDSTGNGEHLKSILKKKSNVENLIGDASYSRLQSLLEEREHRFNGSPILESTSSGALTASPAVVSLLHRETPSPLLLAGHASNSRVVGTPALGRASSSDSSSLVPSTHSGSIVTSHTTTLQKSSLKKKDPLASFINKPERHIHFNTRVDQCIAVDDSPALESDTMSSDSDSSEDVPLGPADENSSFPYSEESEQTFNEYYSGDDSSSLDEDSSFGSKPCSTDSIKRENFDHYDDKDDGLVFKASSLPASMSRKPVHHLSSAHAHSSSYTSIAPLPATALKTCSDDEDENERSMYTVSHNTRTNRGYEYYYDYNRVYSNDANPVYSVVTNGNGDVEMVDVPQSFQMEDAPMTDTPAVVDVPASISSDLPQDVDIGADYDQQSQPLMVNTGDTSLKPTTGIDTAGPSPGVSKIKVGLSGLNLNSTGLRGSTGVGSKQQLFQLADQVPQQHKQQHTKHQHPSRRSSLASQNSRKTFVFGSDSESDSGSDSSSSSCSSCSYSSSVGSDSSNTHRPQYSAPIGGKAYREGLDVQAPQSNDSGSSDDDDDDECFVLNAMPRNRSFSRGAPLSVGNGTTVSGTTNTTVQSPGAFYDKKENSYDSLASLTTEEAPHRRKQDENSSNKNS